VGFGPSRGLRQTETADGRQNLIGARLKPSRELGERAGNAVSAATGPGVNAAPIAVGDAPETYSDVADALETFVAKSSFQLIETFAEQAAALVMAEFGVGWLRLELIKPRSLSGRHVVGVVIERGVRVADGAQVGTATIDRPAPPPAPG
jgi:hypothetical protein